MHHKKRIRRVTTPAKRYNIDNYHINRLERRFYLLFFLALISILVFLYAYSPFTGHAILSSQLDKTSYNTSEKITGIITLEMQENDILPKTAKIGILIRGNTTKCSLKYVCPVIGEVDWYKINSTTGECIIKELDPAKKCCLQNPVNCNQVILNSGFENGITNWVPGRYGATNTKVGTDELVIYDENTYEEIYNSKAGFLSTEQINGNGFISLSQTFTSLVKVADIISVKPNLVVQNINYKISEFNLLTNITICNTGDAPIINQNSTIATKITKVGTTTTSSQVSKIIFNLSPGQCTVYNKTLSLTQSSGQYNLTAIVDIQTIAKPRGDIIELNENDNTRTVIFPANFRDLYVSSIASTYNITTSNLTLKIKICNDYNQALGPFNVSIYSPISYTSPNPEPTNIAARNTFIQFNALSSLTCAEQTKEIPITLSNDSYGYWIWVDGEGRTNDITSNNKMLNEFRVGTTSGGVVQERFSSTENNPDGETLFLDSLPEQNFSTSEKYSLGWIIYSPLSEYDAGGCAFEFIIYGKHKEGTTITDRRLHYYYYINPTICPAPSSNDTDKYYSRSYSQIYGQETGIVHTYTDLYENWVGAFNITSIDDNLTSIAIISYGKLNSAGTYGQTVYVDDIMLDKTASLSNTQETTCESKGKECCIEGAGSGSYYGEQLPCDEGYECWEKCSIVEKTLQDFIAASNTPTKSNITEGDCQIQTDSGIISLGDYCIDGTGFPGKGYTACSDVSSTAITRCRDWNNQYVVNLSKFNLYAPSSEGTYSMEILFTYETIQVSGVTGETEIYNLSTYGLPLIVGTGIGEDIVPTCYDTDYVNCTGNWGACINDIETKLLTCVYGGTTTGCPSTKTFTQTRQCVQNTTTVACGEYDWDCTSWGECINGNQIRGCDKINTCDASLPESFIPEQQQACEPEEEKSKFDWKYLLYFGIAVIVGLIIFLIIKFVVPAIEKGKITSGKSDKLGIEKKSEAKDEYPELTNYIKDALASGMNPAEIKAKLQEAGWPKEAVDNSFKKFR